MLLHINIEHSVHCTALEVGATPVNTSTWFGLVWQWAAVAVWGLPLSEEGTTGAVSWPGPSSCIDRRCGRGKIGVDFKVGNPAS